MLTAKCNLNCYFCMNEYCVSAKEDTIFSGSDFKNLINLGYEKAKMTEISFTGGEPLLCENFAEISKSCSNDFTNITLVTNGILLKDRINELKNIAEIHISIHSLDFAEWNKVTSGSLDQFKKLMEGVRLTREKYVDMPIRLNVVGTEFNGKDESLNKYVMFANEYNLSICVFREGYLDWANKNCIILNNNLPTHSLWNMENLGAHLVSVDNNSREYNFESVKIILRETSTHVPVWDSIWVDPNGYAYTDVMLTGERIKINVNEKERLGIQIDKLISTAKLHH